MVKKNNLLRLKPILKILIVVFIFLSGIAFSYYIGLKKGYKNNPNPTQEDKYTSFIFEVYDKIQENYWDKINDQQLTDLYKLGIEKLTSQPQDLKSDDREGLKNLLIKELKNIDSEEKKKEFVVSLADIVLANLKPFGRSRLYSQKQEQDLKNSVQNINPDIDQYDILEVDKNASLNQIEKNYQVKKEEWNPETNKSPEAEQKYQEIEKAHEILSNPDNRTIYDQTGVEPTISYKLIRPTIFYIHLIKFSPTSFDELKRITEEVDNVDGLDSLILDLRDNVGGAIDLLPYILGPFIGPDQYAYQFFHQGEKTDFKTKTGWLPSLVRYKKVMILINENTQSSAELMAASLKKYHVGVVVGTPTKGWGTIEKIYPLENQLTDKEKFSLFLVHHLSLRDDNQPIEGIGVEPNINISDSNWEQELYSYFNYSDLVEATKEALTSN